MPRICFNLVFDHSTEQAVRDMWQRIADADVPVRGLTGYRPHVTLAAYDVTSVRAYESDLVPVTEAMEPFPIRLESLGIFPEAGAIFLAPRMSRTLFSLHRAILGAVDSPGRPPVVDECLLPDRWTPHCTLAGHLTRTQLLTAVDVCQRHWMPILGKAVGVGMRVYPAVDAHYYYPFRHCKKG